MMYLHYMVSVDTLDTMYLRLCTCCRAASEHSSALVILTSRGLDTLGQIIVWNMINVNVTRYLHWYGQWRPCLHCDRGDGCGSSSSQNTITTNHTIYVYVHTIYTPHSPHVPAVTGTVCQGKLVTVVTGELLVPEYGEVTHRHWAVITLCVLHHCHSAYQSPVTQPSSLDRYNNCVDNSLLAETLTNQVLT